MIYSIVTSSITFTICTTRFVLFTVLQKGKAWKPSGSHAFILVLRKCIQCPNTLSHVIAET
jgi:hypothetical protein